MFRITQLQLKLSSRFFLASHCIIATAPFVLGFISSLAGRKQDLLADLNQRQEAVISKRTSQLTIQNEKLEAEIEERHLIEERLVLARDEAEAGAKAKAQFLSNMSHEIRTPLNAVIGMTGLLLDTELDDEQHAYLRTVKISGENLLGVINNILDYSKIDSGKLEIERIDFNITDAVEDVLDLLASKASEKDLELIYYVDDSVATYIQSDITRLRQILVNLVNRAYWFSI